MEARLASSVLVGALLRLAEAEGGFATVLAKGDQTAGAVTVILTEKGGNPRFFERLLQPDGRYAWEESRQTIENEQQLKAFLERRRNFDPDLWILELDIASSERFAAEMNAIG
jgi:hypothetical protein